MTNMPDTMIDIILCKTNVYEQEKVHTQIYNKSILLKFLNF